jgi:hypothetical protein
MKKNLIYLFVFLGTLAVSGIKAQAQSPKQDNPVATQQQVKYTCTMHPQVIEDKPGNCPICGMKLVEMKSTPETMPNDSTHMEHNQSMHNSTNQRHQQQMMNDSTMKKNHTMH